MIYDDQPQAFEAARISLQDKSYLGLNMTESARCAEDALGAFFAAVDREELIEKAALGCARPKGIQPGDLITARKILVAAGIIPERES